MIKNLIIYRSLTPTDWTTKKTQRACIDYLLWNKQLKRITHLLYLWKMDDFTIIWVPLKNFFARTTKKQYVSLWRKKWCEMNPKICKRKVKRPWHFVTLICLFIWKKLGLKGREGGSLCYRGISVRHESIVKIFNIKA